MPIQPETCRGLLQLILQQDHRTPTSKSLLKDLKEDDWVILTREAIRSRLAHPFRRFLLSDPEFASEALPTVCLNRLDRALRKTLMANLKQQAVFKKIAGACEAQGIDFMLVKGLWLTETIYRDLTARRSSDIDLILKPEDMPRFTAMVAGMGFDIPPGATDIRDIALGTKEYAITEPKTGAYIDVHWGLVDSSEQLAVGEETFWALAEENMIAGRCCRSLCLEDQLLYLAFHAAILHRFIYVGPRAFVDIAQMIRTPYRAMDWEFLVRRADELGWSRSVWLVLDLASTHFSATVPPEVLKRLEPSDVVTGHTKSLDTIKQAALFNVWENQNSKDSWALTFWMRILSHKSGSKRIAFVFRSLFPSRTYLQGYFKYNLPRAGLQTQRMKRLRLMVDEKKGALQRFLSLAIRQRKELKGVIALTQWLNP